MNTKLIVINEELHRKLKAACALHGKSMKEVIEGLIKARLRKWENE